MFEDNNYMEHFIIPDEAYNKWAEEYLEEEEYFRCLSEELDVEMAMESDFYEPEFYLV